MMDPIENFGQGVSFRLPLGGNLSPNLYLRILNSIGHCQRSFDPETSEKRKYLLSKVFKDSGVPGS